MTPRRTRARARATRLARLSNSLADGGVHRRQLPSAYIIARPSWIRPREMDVTAIFTRREEKTSREADAELGFAGTPRCFITSST